MLRTHHHFICGFSDPEGFFDRRVQMRGAQVESQKGFGEGMPSIEEEIVDDLTRLRVQPRLKCVT